MIHAAKQFGISDVALRKTCVKHNIPTPPMGYWAKVAHGKRVARPPLPALRAGDRDHINLALRPKRQLPAAASAALAAAQIREAADENRIAVPKQRPAAFHAAVAATERALRKARPDHEGFLHIADANCFKARIGPASAERTLLILDTLAKAIEARGYAVQADNGVSIMVDGEPLSPTIYETRRKSAYEPTPADLKKQAEYDERSRRSPTFYRPGIKMWPTWSYAPSARLCLEITDPACHSWNNEHVIGRWYDRKTRRLEEYLGEVMIVLAPAAALIKHRRAEAEEQARIRAEQAELRRREAARRERAAKRHDFLLKKADAYAQHTKLLEFCEFLESQVSANRNEPVDRLAAILRRLVEDKRREFGRSALNTDATELGLFADDDQS